MDDGTANWKTYKNSNYGFLIKYPKELFSKEDNNRKMMNGESLFVLSDTNSFIGQDFSLNQKFQITILKPIAGQTPDVFLNSIVNSQFVLEQKKTLAKII
ncbi:hypothetical protein KKG52_03180 [Patescibacteria group bacterium]|nr:hypothetical protein [Patescibacteria group bacterium]